MAGEWTFTTDDGGKVRIELLDDLPERDATDQFYAGQHFPTRLAAIEAAAVYQRILKRTAAREVKRLGDMARRERAKLEGGR